MSVIVVVTAVNHNDEPRVVEEYPDNTILSRKQTHAKTSTANCDKVIRIPSL